MFCNLRAAITIDADEVTYDFVIEKAIASGNVVIKDNGIIRIKTENVEYSKKEHKIKLNGKSVYFGKRGETIYANNFELDDTLQNGIIESFDVILANKAYIKAKSGKKQNNQYVFQKAIYSPCYASCSKPLWEISADKVLYDQIEKEMSYEKAKMKMRGKTILYMPYFSHPSLFFRPLTSVRPQDSLVASTDLP